MSKSYTEMLRNTVCQLHCSSDCPLNAYSCTCGHLVEAAYIRMLPASELCRSPNG